MDDTANNAGIAALSLSTPRSERIMTPYPPAMAAADWRQSSVKAASRLRSPPFTSYSIGRVIDLNFTPAVPCPASPRWRSLFNCSVVRIGEGSRICLAHSGAGARLFALGPMGVLVDL